MFGSQLVRVNRSFFLAVVADKVAEGVLQTLALGAAQAVVKGVVPEDAQVLVVVSPAAGIALELARVVADEAHEVLLLRVHDAFVAHNLVSEEVAESLAVALLLEHRLVLGLGPRLGFDSPADGRRDLAALAREACAAMLAIFNLPAILKIPAN